METAGKQWVAKQIHSHCAISNALTLGTDYDLTSEDKRFDFAKKNDTHFMAMMGAAHKRRSASLKGLATLEETKSASLESMMANLRQHHRPDQQFNHHDNRDICMHAGSLLRPSQTCGSMVVALQKDQAPKVMMTGTSAPCLSLFKAIPTDRASAFESKEVNSSLWFLFESVHRRALLDTGFRQALCASRDVLEQQLVGVYQGSLSWEDAEQHSLDWHQGWHDEAIRKPFRYSFLSRYQQYWRRLNQRDGIL